MITTTTARPNRTTGQPSRAGASPQAREAVQCRYLRQTAAGVLDRCTGTAVDPLGEVLLCVRHLARAIELINARGDLLTALRGAK